MVSATTQTRRPRLRSAMGLILALPLAGLVVTLAACLPVAVGDPEQSEADPALTGAWVWEPPRGKRQMFVVHRYDKRTYLVQWFQYGMYGGQVEPERMSQYKGWLTELGGERFMTLEPLSARQRALPGEGGESPLGDQFDYVVTRVELAEDGETLKVRGLDSNSSLLNSVHSREEAERIIRKHVDDEDLYARGDAVEIRKLSQYDTEEVRAVLEAFKAE